MPKKPAPREDSRAKRRLETIAAALGAMLAAATLGIIA